MIWLLPGALVVLAFGWLVGEIAERRGLRITCAALFILGTLPVVVIVGVTAFLGQSNVSLSLTGAMVRWLDAASEVMEAGEGERLRLELRRVQLIETYEPETAVEALEQSAARLKED